jgi:hypothetical protein
MDIDANLNMMLSTIAECIIYLSPVDLFSKGSHLGVGNTPDTDDIIGVTGEEDGTVNGPSEGDTLGIVALFTDTSEFGTEFRNNRLGF